MSTTFHPVEEYLRQGISVIPLKQKVAAIKWAEYQTRQPTLGEVANWFGHGTRHNVGIVTGSVSNLVAVDFDTREAAVKFWKEVAQTTAINQTRKGLHFLFQHPGVPVKNGVRVCEGTDIRGDGGYIVAPPSKVEKHLYEWLAGFELTHPKDLPVFNPEWIPDKSTVTKTAKVEHSAIRRYVLKIESIQGRNGNKGLMRAIYKCKDAGLSEAETTALLMEWNQTSVVDPPWPIPELTRAVSRVYSIRQEEKAC